mmetsp:Transcript_102614/g.313811  ORF Transcript_102614/g.313811 Transcript_102614/m.313811 type:complete len:200 (+) Transcript_102614:267-866(+)
MLTTTYVFHPGTCISTTSSGVDSMSQKPFQRRGIHSTSCAEYGTRVWAPNTSATQAFTSVRTVSSKRLKSPHASRRAPSTTALSDSTVQAAADTVNVDSPSFTLLCVANRAARAAARGMEKGENAITQYADTASVGTHIASPSWSLTCSRSSAALWKCHWELSTLPTLQKKPASVNMAVSRDKKRKLSTGLEARNWPNS